MFGGCTSIYQLFCYFAVNWDSRVLTHAHFALTSYVNMVWFFFMKLRRCCANSCVSATTGSWVLVFPFTHPPPPLRRSSVKQNVVTQNIVTNTHDCRIQHCHTDTTLSHTTLSHIALSRTTLSHTQHCPGRALGDTHGMFCQMPCLEHRSPWWSRLSRFFFCYTRLSQHCVTHTTL